MAFSAEFNKERLTREAENSVCFHFHHSCIELFCLSMGDQECSRKKKIMFSFVLFYSQKDKAKGDPDFPETLRLP